MPAVVNDPGSTGSGTTPSGPVRLGSLTFQWSPHHIRRVKRPNVYRQNGINAWLLNDYGWMPDAYTLEGYLTGDLVPFWPDPTLRDQIVAQFTDPTTVVKFQAPYMGISTTVRLISLTDDTDSSRAPGEVTFSLELEEADGQVTYGAAPSPTPTPAGGNTSGGINQ